MKVFRALVTVALTALLATGLVASSAQSQPAHTVINHYTVHQLETPPFSSCMAAAGQPSVPAPGSKERRTWPAERQAAYHDAFWACFETTLEGHPAYVEIVR